MEYKLLHMAINTNEVYVSVQGESGILPQYRSREF
jgi:hypothetical protein